MASGFSRLQLAAALLEYDNDPDNPEAPHRSAHESAIFAHLRRNAGTRPRVVSHRSSHLNVSIGEGGSALAGNRNSTMSNTKSRASRGSIDALRNPFGADDSQLEYENEDEEEELEVDLASWGLDAFLPKDKASRTGKGKAKSTDLATSHSVSSVPSHHPLTSNDAVAVVTAPRRALGASRSMSVGGNLEYFGTEGAMLERQTSLKMETRRRSIGSPLDLSNMKPPQMPLQRRRATSHTLGQTSSTSPQAIPFPTTSVNPPLLYAAEEFGVSRPHAAPFDSHPGPHERVLSTTSMDSKVMFQENDRRSRTISNAPVLLADDNPFSLRPPSRASRFDPKAAAHARTTSNASMGSRILIDNDGVSAVTDLAQLERERRYSTTLDLLRPKVLVMPSPLQSAPAPPPPPNDQLRDGFLLSKDGPPLPPGARSARRSSMSLSMIEATPPIASNSFTPNPLTSLSLSQMTFRDTLPNGTQRNSVYMDRSLPRATEDGEQVNIEVTVAEEELMPTSPSLEDPSKPRRPAGKLYGKSLIDDLETRKAQMRSKQRVFTGDQRPSMMARGLQRSSTLIDPAALQTRPNVPRTSSYEPQAPQTLARRNSANAKPLLNFDDDDKVLRPNLSSAILSNSRSVFGVDTLWEREMVKLREIEEQEKVQAEARRKREEAEEDNKKRRKKQKHKAKGAAEVNSPETGHPSVSAEPPLLPDIQRATRRPPPVPDDESETDESEDAGPSRMLAAEASWHAGSSDEDTGPRRTTGTGPRYPDERRRRPSQPVDINSDDDLPLSVAVNRAAQRATLSRPGTDSDDEGKPLSMLLQKKQIHLPAVDFDNLLNRELNDDDNQPLGLRASRFGAHSQGDPGNDDDERPLAYHPEQQRRTQYQMMVQQQQQQQQQLMLQAQMQNNMFFSTPSMMGPQFYGPQMMPIMMQPPIQGPSPPIHDEVKYGRVDRWRHDVAVEGDA